MFYSQFITTISPPQYINLIPVSSLKLRLKSVMINSHYNTTVDQKPGGSCQRGNKS